MIIIYHSQGEPLLCERITKNGFLRIIKKSITHVLLQESLFFDILKKILTDKRDVLKIFMGKDKNIIEPYDIRNFYKESIC